MVVVNISNFRETLWDKQWKKRRRCLDKFALGRSRGKSDFPERRSPEGNSDFFGTLPEPAKVTLKKFTKVETLVASGGIFQILAL